MRGATTPPYQCRAVDWFLSRGAPSPMKKAARLLCRAALPWARCFPRGVRHNLFQVGFPPTSGEPLGGSSSPSGLPGHRTWRREPHEGSERGVFGGDARLPRRSPDADRLQPAMRSALYSPVRLSPIGLGILASALFPLQKLLKQHFLFLFVQWGPLAIWSRAPRL